MTTSTCPTAGTAELFAPAAPARDGGPARLTSTRPAHAPATVEAVVPVLLLTVEQAARCLAVGRTAVYELIAKRQLGSVRIGSSRRIPRTALDAYVHRLCHDAGIPAGTPDQ